MMLDAPIPFAQALKYAAQKSILPTDMSSAELSTLRQSIRERSLFSARTAMESHLKEIGSVVEDILNPRVSLPAHGTTTLGIDPATARLKLKESLQALGYNPGDKAGTIEDLGSDQRLNLILKTNVEMAQGYGGWRNAQDEEALDAFPAQRLVRFEERNEKRNWHERAKGAAGETGSNIVLEGDEEVVALKNDPFWSALSEFGTPYPPFDFNSGMWIEDVDREEAVALGLIDEDTQIQPLRRGFEMDEAGATSR